MNINRFFLNVDDDNVNNKRQYFHDNYPDTVHLFLIGNWFKVFNRDAEIVSNIFNYKLFNDRYYLQNICCGFPKTIIEKISITLDKYKINYNIIDIEKGFYELHDFGDENYYMEYYEKYIDFDNDEEVIVNDSKVDTFETNEIFVEIGDTVTIMNVETGEVEKYTIEKSYYTSKPVGVSKLASSFGSIVYREELLSNSDVDNGVILSDSEFAKSLMGLFINDYVLLFDDNLDKCKYQIIEIKKP